MYKNKTYLAVIPARGGSKRVPRKNILQIAGKPLIGWSIESALHSKYIDKVIVTSDDEEILAISKQCGAEIINRPIELANDTATTFSALKHTIDNVDYHDYIILLQPTSPLRTSEHIDEAIAHLELHSADAIISVSEMEHSPLWCNTLPENMSMNKFLSEDVKNLRSQDLKKYYRLNGAIFICKTNRLLNEKSFFIKDNIFAYIMDRKNAIDIDELIDFEMAELYLNKKQKEEI